MRRGLRRAAGRSRDAAALSATSPTLTQMLACGGLLRQPVRMLDALADGWALAEGEWRDFNASVSWPTVAAQHFATRVRPIRVAFQADR